MALPPEPAVYDFGEDVILYLQNWYDYHKLHTKKFSYRIFGEKTGLSDLTLLQKILKRKRPLTNSAVPAFSEAIGHTDDEAEFFSLLARLERQKATILKSKTDTMPHLNLQEWLHTIPPASLNTAQKHEVDLLQIHAMESVGRTVHDLAVALGCSQTNLQHLQHLAVQEELRYTIRCLRSWWRGKSRDVFQGFDMPWEPQMASRALTAIDFALRFPEVEPGSPRQHIENMLEIHRHSRHTLERMHGEEDVIRETVFLGLAQIEDSEARNALREELRDIIAEVMGRSKADDEEARPYLLQIGFLSCTQALRRTAHFELKSVRLPSLQLSQYARSNKLDYRSYIKDWYDALNEGEKEFSLRRMVWRLMGRRATLKEENTIRSRLSYIMNGKRHLRGKEAPYVADGLGLDREERDLFCAMVQHDTEKFENSRQLLAARVERLASILETGIVRDAKRRRLATHWYYLTILELSNHPDFQDDGNWVASTLRPQITVAEAEAALEDLKNAGLLIDSVGGGKQPCYDKLNFLIAPDAKTLDDFVHHGHLSFESCSRRSLEAALEARNPPDFLNLGAVIALTEAELRRVRARLYAFWAQMMKVASNRTHSDEVLQLHIWLMPAESQITPV